MSRSGAEEILESIWKISASRLQRLFKRWVKGRHAVPDGLRIYAVGDVHGCLDELKRLLERIDRDLGSSRIRSHLIFLGDLVDRGPQSAGVIKLILAGSLPADGRDCLMGNHEEVLLACYDGNVEAYDRWLNYGGVQTLESYGLTAAAIAGPGVDLGAAMRRSIPETHVEFLRGMKDAVRLGDYLFVHAGVRPGIPLEEQSSRDRRWIRTGFLDDLTDHGLMIVHGHSIVRGVEFHPNRIAVDTGCYLTGRLSALVLEGSDSRVLTVRAK